MLLLAPIIWLYYFEQGCAAYAAQPQLTLTASLTRKLSCYKNSSMVVLKHHHFRGADSPRNIFSTVIHIVYQTRDISPSSSKNQPLDEPL